MLKLKSYILFVLITSIIFLSGCVPIYRPPATGPIAFLGTQRNYLIPDIIDIYGDPCRGISPFVPMFGDRNSGRPFAIGADTLQTIGVTHRCGPTDFFFAITFVPRANNTYFVNVKDHSERGYIVSNLELWEISPQDKINNYYHLAPFVSWADFDTADIQNALLKGQYNTLPKATSVSKKRRPEPIVVVL